MIFFFIYFGTSNHRYRAQESEVSLVYLVFVVLRGLSQSCFGHIVIVLWQNLADSCGEQVIHVNLSRYFQKFCFRNLLWPKKWHVVSKICCVEG